MWQSFDSLYTSMPDPLIEDIRDFVIDTAQDHAIEAIDNSQNIVG